MSENFEPRQLKQHDTSRLHSYQEYLDFYNGRHWESHPRYGETRLTFNYAKVIIDKVTSYLMSEITFNVDASADTEYARASARRAELALQRVYAENNLRQLDYETEIDCAIMGDGCFKVTWDSAAKRVRVSAPDVQGIYAWWWGDDTSRLWREASRYQLDAGAAASGCTLIMSICSTASCTTSRNHHDPPSAAPSATYPV